MSRSRLSSRSALALLLGLGGLVLAASAQAETGWAASHPRQAQVLERTTHLQRRITEEVRTGEIGPARAYALRRQVGRLRAREQALARRNGGYITPQQQAALNAQEDRISRRVGP